MKTYRGVVVTTYYEEMVVQANTRAEAELLMYDQANPQGDGINGEMEIEGLTEVKGESK